MRRSLPRLILVTDDRVVEGPEFLARAREALTAGGLGCALQLRAQRQGGARLWALARQLKDEADVSGSTLWINDRLDVALVVRAHGVQLGRRALSASAAKRLLGEDVWIGASVHSPLEAAEALTGGADLAVLGNIYETSSHPEREPLGVDAVRRAADGGRSIVAIGGITPERAAEVMEAGACGVAVLGGVWLAGDTAAAVRLYRQAIAGAVGRDEKAT